MIIQKTKKIEKIQKLVLGNRVFLQNLKWLVLFKYMPRWKNLMCNVLYEISRTIFFEQPLNKQTEHAQYMTLSCGSIENF